MLDDFNLFVSDIIYLFTSDTSKLEHKVSFTLNRALEMESMSDACSQEAQNVNYVQEESVKVSTTQSHFDFVPNQDMDERRESVVPEISITSERGLGVPSNDKDGLSDVEYIDFNESEVLNSGALVEEEVSTDEESPKTKKRAERPKRRVYRKNKNSLNVSKRDQGCVTDTEDLDDDIDLNEIPDVDIAKVENILAGELSSMRESQADGTIDRVYPNVDIAMANLALDKDDLEGTTDVEDFVGSTEDLRVPGSERRFTSPEPPRYDVGVTESSEKMKTDKKMRVPDITQMGLTDTEELFMDEHFPLRKKRSKSRQKNKKGKTNLLGLSVAAGGESDMYSSDGMSDASTATSMQLLDDMRLPGNLEGGKTDNEDFDLSGSDIDSYNPTMPDDVLHQYEGSDIMAVKDNPGRKSINLDALRATLATPDARSDLGHTDVEDMLGSGDETASPPRPASPELETHSSVIQMKSDAALNYDDPSERNYLKASGHLSDALTDTEEVDVAKLGVNDTSREVCVCYAAESKSRNNNFCICYEKKSGALSLKKGGGGPNFRGTSDYVVKETLCRPGSSNLVQSSELSVTKTEQGYQTTMYVEMLKNPLCVQPKEMMYVNLPATYEFLCQPIKVEGNSEHMLLLCCIQKIAYRFTRGNVDVIKLPVSIKGRRGNVSNLICKFEKISHRIPKNMRGLVFTKHNMTVLTNSLLRPMIQITCLNDRTNSPGRITPSSIQDTEAYKALNSKILQTRKKQERYQKSDRNSKDKELMGSENIQGNGSFIFSGGSSGDAIG